MSEHIETSDAGASAIRDKFAGIGNGGGKVHELGAWRHHLDMGDKGPKRTLSNLMVHLRWLPELGSNIRFNELTGVADWRGVQIEDAQLVDIQMIVESANFQPRDGDLRKAVARLALNNAYHPIRDYLDGLKWDGKPRLDAMLPSLFGTPSTEYERTVGSKWMIGAVARVYEPGCKMDNMLVLEGPQGIGKSTGLATLFGQQYVGVMISDLKDHKKFMEQVAGKWVMEFAELAAVKKENMEHVKAIITLQDDESRMAYGQVRADRPRRCVLAATVNPRADMGYLSDPTGNRRFWPVACTKINMPGLTSHRDQLWAEATHRYRQREQWWLDEKQTLVAAAEQAERVAVDPWADILSERLVPGQRYTSVEIAAQFLLVTTDRIDQNVKKRISEVMTGLGWAQRVGRNADRKSVRVWQMEGL